MKKAKTINLQGQEYARVAERIKLFREACPRGSIDTYPDIQEDGTILFKAIVVKDQKDEHSARATGHALGEKKLKKDFEKLESIAVGRALAMLGYLASGEIASGEEMLEFLEEKEQERIEKIEELRTKVYKCNDMDELKELFVKNKLVGGAEFAKAVTERKQELSSPKENE